MKTLAASEGMNVLPDAGPDIAAERRVIAVVIEWRGRIALFKRSQQLKHDSGLWHCITGFVEPGRKPHQQALQELSEETGLQDKDLLDFQQGPALTVADEFGYLWLIHTFTAVTSRRRLRIDWEHDTYRWTTAQKTERFTNRVSWLDTVLAATGHIEAHHNRGLSE